jgi:hypothetical protein
MLHEHSWRRRSRGVMSHDVGRPFHLGGHALPAFSFTSPDGTTQG